MSRFAPLVVCALGLHALASDLPSPAVSRVDPLGGQRGTEVELEILGRHLSNVSGLEFDSADIAWTATTYASAGKLRGVVSIAADAALGPHLFRVRTADGYSTTAMFNVGQFRDLREAEPNDVAGDAQEIAGLPREVQGVLEGSKDIDVFAIHAQAGERLAVELRSIEYGSAVEAKMSLLDRDGRRVRFNDDRDDYLETPFIDHTFQEAGTHYIKVDQYRGPRGFNFGKNSSYILRASALPTIEYAAPLGIAIGSSAKLTLHGSGLGAVQSVFVTSLRAAEYARMTYPYTMPIHFRPDPARGPLVPRIEGKVVQVNQDEVVVELAVPADAEAGLWRVWVAGASGIADGPIIELGSLQEFAESNAASADWRDGGYVIDGVLGAPGERDVFAIHGVAGVPLRFWTLATQLGVPHLDPVLTIRDSEGRRLAENDDVVAGQGTLLGNPDSRVYYTPDRDDVFFVEIRDRTSRGGPSYRYRLKVRSERPSFQLFTTPENFAVARGGEGEFKVHLVREAGFSGEVSIWVEGMPPGVAEPEARFRADQLFEPNADGADMIIPEHVFRIGVPESLPLGTYPIRVLGTPTADESSPDRRVVEARSTLIMGPLLDLWNFVRRPLPAVEMTVVEPPVGGLSTATESVTLAQGGHATLEMDGVDLPVDAPLTVKGLPQGVSAEVRRHGQRFMVDLAATPEAVVGSCEISAEVLVRERWVASGLIGLTVEPAPTAPASSERRAEPAG